MQFQYILVPEWIKWGENTMKKLIKILLLIDLAVIVLGCLITYIVEIDMYGYSTQLPTLIWELPAICAIYSILILLIAFIIMKLNKKLKARHVQKSDITGNEEKDAKPVAQPVDTENICPVCRNVCSRNSRFCDNCGLKLPEPISQPSVAEIICPACRTVCCENSKFCFNCGEKLPERIHQTIDV